MRCVQVLMIRVERLRFGKTNLGGLKSTTTQKMFTSRSWNGFKTNGSEFSAQRLNLFRWMENPTGHICTKSRHSFFSAGSPRRIRIPIVSCQNFYPEVMPTGATLL